MRHILVDGDEGDFRLDGDDMVQLVAESLEHLEIVTLRIHFQEDPFAMTVGGDFVQHVIESAGAGAVGTGIFCGRVGVWTPVDQ